MKIEIAREPNTRRASVSLAISELIAAASYPDRPKISVGRACELASAVHAYLADLEQTIVCNSILGHPEGDELKEMLGRHGIKYEGQTSEVAAADVLTAVAGCADPGAEI